MVDDDCPLYLPPTMTAIYGVVAAYAISEAPLTAGFLTSVNNLICFIILLLYYASVDSWDMLPRRLYRDSA
jgi:hypothetical protein